MKTFKKLALFIAGGLIAAGTVVACGSGFHHASAEKKAEHIVEEINDELTLNDSQQAKLNTLKDHVLKLRQEHKANKTKTHEELRALLDKPYLDEEVILSHVNTKTAYINQQAPEVIAMLADFYNSLDESQKNELREHVDKFSKRHKRWHAD